MDETLPLSEVTPEKFAEGMRDVAHGLTEMCKRGYESAVLELTPINKQVCSLRVLDSLDEDAAAAGAVSVAFPLFPQYEAQMGALIDALMEAMNEMESTGLCATIH